MERISSNDTSSMDTTLNRIMEQMKTAKKGNQRNNKNSQKKTGGVKINLTSYMVRLANAKTTLQVDGVIRAVDAEAYSLKAKGATNQETAAAMRIAKKVRNKGTLKIYGLRKEESMKRLSDLHKNAKNQPEATELLNLLKSKKRSRKAKEQMDIIHSIKSDKNEESYTQIQSQTGMGTIDSEIAGSVGIVGSEINLTDSMITTESIDFLL